VWVGVLKMSSSSSSLSLFSAECKGCKKVILCGEDHVKLSKHLCVPCDYEASESVDYYCGDCAARVCTRCNRTTCSSHFPMLYLHADSTICIYCVIESKRAKLENDTSISSRDVNRIMVSGVNDLDEYDIRVPFTGDDDSRKKNIPTLVRCLKGCNAERKLDETTQCLSCCNTRVCTDTCLKGCPKCLRTWCVWCHDMRINSKGTCIDCYPDRTRGAKRSSSSGGGAEKKQKRPSRSTNDDDDDDDDDKKEEKEETKEEKVIEKSTSKPKDKKKKKKKETKSKSKPKEKKMAKGKGKGKGRGKGKGKGKGTKAT
jgi:hypothetical protein